jgi:hypothetical protein
MIVSTTNICQWVAAEFLTNFSRYCHRPRRLILSPSPFVILNSLVVIASKAWQSLLLTNPAQIASALPCLSMTAGRVPLRAKRGNPMFHHQIASALPCLSMTQGRVSLRAKRGNLMFHHQIASALPCLAMTAGRVPLRAKRGNLMFHHQIASVLPCLAMTEGRASLRAKRGNPMPHHQIASADFVSLAMTMA